MARARRGLSRAGLVLLAAVPLGFLAVFFVWPVAAILRLGLSEGGVLEVLGRADTWRLAAFTIGQAAASTALALLAGLPVAFLLARTSLPGLGFVRVLVLVPFVLPTVVVGLAFRALLFALTPVQATGLRAAVFVAYQIDASGAVLRAEGPLPVNATGPAEVRLGPVARVDPGPERLRFAFVDRQPSGGEIILDAWSEPLRMPAAVRIDRSDPRTGAVVGSLRVPLLVDAEPGCVDPQKGACSRVERGAQPGAATGQPASRTDASGEQQ